MCRRAFCPRLCISMIKKLVFIGTSCKMKVTGIMLLVQSHLESSWVPAYRIIIRHQLPPLILLRTTDVFQDIAHKAFDSSLTPCFDAE